MSEQPEEDRPLFGPAFGWTVLDVNDRLGRFADYLEGQGVELEGSDGDLEVIVVDQQEPG